MIKNPEQAKEKEREERLKQIRAIRIPIGRYTRITLRIPRDAYAKLERIAHEKSHSMDAEIIGRIEASLNALPA